MKHFPQVARLCLTTVAAWLAVIATGASIVHCHDDDDGAAGPHRHLILFGVECPAESADGGATWQAPVDPTGDAADAASPPVVTDAPNLSSVEWPAVPVPGRARLSAPPSIRRARCAVLRA